VCVCEWVSWRDNVNHWVNTGRHPMRQWRRRRRSAGGRGCGGVVLMMDEWAREVERASERQRWRQHCRRVINDYYDPTFRTRSIYAVISSYHARASPIIQGHCWWRRITRGWRMSFIVKTVAWLRNATGD